jgi:hypothetical protein
VPCIIPGTRPSNCGRVLQDGHDCGVEVRTRPRSTLFSLDCHVQLSGYLKQPRYYLSGLDQKHQSEMTLISNAATQSTGGGKPHTRRSAARMLDSQIESSRPPSLPRAQGLPGQSQNVNSLRMPRQGPVTPQHSGRPAPWSI